MAESTLSRRISETIGVVAFALALIWLSALITYDPHDPVWFFTTDTSGVPLNLMGRVGAFLAELSFQLFGYAAFLIPAVIGVIGWHYFWCQPPEAAYTKVVGVTLLFACSSAIFSLLLGSAGLGASKTFHGGGSIGLWIGDILAEYLNRTGSIIVLLTLVFLAVILSTQFSFGRLFESAGGRSRDLSVRGVGRLRAWLDERRKTKARRVAIARQTEKAQQTNGKAAKPPADDARPGRAPRCLATPGWRARTGARMRTASTGSRRAP